MLVLLIIFMIASPFMNVEEEEGEDLNVPKVTTAVNLGESEHLLVINTDGTLLLNETHVNRQELDSFLVQLVDQKTESGEIEGLKLYIAADETVTWKNLAEIMSIAKNAGVEKIGMVEELIEGEIVLELEPDADPS